MASIGSQGPQQSIPITFCRADGAGCSDVGLDAPISSRADRGIGSQMALADLGYLQRIVKTDSGNVAHLWSAREVMGRMLKSNG